nr:hypothetical protein [Kofleriaceae bacterium]
MTEPPEDQVPKIPFAKGMRLSVREMIRIVMVAAMLVVVVVMQKPCGDAVSRFVSGFDDPNADQPAVEMPKPDNLERIAPTATPEQQKAAVDKAKQDLAPAAPPAPSPPPPAPPASK